MEDFIALRGVCRLWQATVGKELFEGLRGLSKIPLLMLGEKDGGGDDRQLYSLSQKAVCGTRSFLWFKNKRCIYAGFGWVLTVAAEGGEVNLVKRFTGAVIELPNFTLFPGYQSVVPESAFVERDILSAGPSESAFVVVIQCRCPHGVLGYWSLGEENWKVGYFVCDGLLNIGYYRGMLCDIDGSRRVYMRDPMEITSSKLIVHLDLDFEVLYMRPYFAESSSSELLVVFRGFGFAQFQTLFKVVRIDVENGIAEGMEGGIGRDAIFLGESATVCADADDFPGLVKPNCVYFTDDDIYAYWCGCKDQTTQGGGKDMGIYNFEDGSIEKFSVEESSIFPSPPLWIYPPF